MPPPDCPGCNRSTLGYLAWHRDADRRHRAGQRQHRCPVCGLWCWPDELRGNGGVPAALDPRDESVCLVEIKGK